GKICRLPRPKTLCARAGRADSFCKEISTSFSGAKKPRCYANRTCAFTVMRPVQHPSTPGEAYVSLCKPDFAGVIFPCRSNNLMIINAHYNDDEPAPEGMIDLRLGNI
ncbi:Hypothetical predicted protein, partial [Olea europaea subsp. europaea]